MNREITKNNHCCNSLPLKQKLGQDGKPGNECVDGGRQWSKPTAGLCEMEMGGE